MTCSCNFFTEAVEGLVFGVADRLEELGIRPVAAARVPAGAVAGLITGRGAAGRVKFGDGGPQADDGARVDTRTGRAVEDPGDSRGQFTGLLEHLRARAGPAPRLPERLPRFLGAHPVRLGEQAQERLPVGLGDLQRDGQGNSGGRSWARLGDGLGGRLGDGGEPAPQPRDLLRRFVSDVGRGGLGLPVVVQGQRR
jgi:hypothetical protein